MTATLDQWHEKIKAARNGGRRERAALLDFTEEHKLPPIELIFAFCDALRDRPNTPSFRARQLASAANDYYDRLPSDGHEKARAAVRDNPKYEISKADDPDRLLHNVLTGMYPGVRPAFESEYGRPFPKLAKARNGVS